MEEIKIIIYGKEDLKKSGGFKIKNNVKEITKTEFFKYLKDSLGFNTEIEEIYNY